MASQLAGSDSAADHQDLLQALNSKQFLLRLNSEDEYAGDANRLRVGRILNVLRTNAAPPARQTLLALTKSKIFLEAGGRVDLLIGATAIIRPPPPDLIAFWDAHSQPDDGFTPLTIQALFDNSTEPAMLLLERKLMDPAHQKSDKVQWLRFGVLPNRNSVPVIESCSRLLKGSLDDELKAELIDVLYDYKPGVWFTPAVNLNPPSLSTYSAAARQQLHALAIYTRDHVKLRQDQIPIVRRAIEQFER